MVSFQKPDAAAEWVVNSFALDDPQRFTLLRRVLPYLARQDPNQAFELAIAEPTPSRGVGLVSGVFDALTREGNIELALKLLPRVKEDRVWACVSVGRAMVRDLRTDEALKLGKDFGGREQRIYHQWVLGEWTDNYPKNLFESLEGLSSSSIMSMAATQLIQRNLRDPIFTDDQIDFARTFLNSEDEARVKRSEN